MKVKIILNGEMVETFKGSAEKLIEMGRAYYPGKEPKKEIKEQKVDYNAENRKTKVVKPQEFKAKKKRGRPKKQQ